MLTYHNRIFITLTIGYQGGVLMEEGATADYTIIDTNTIEFVNVVDDTDKITLRVQQ